MSRLVEFSGDKDMRPVFLSYGLIAVLLAGCGGGASNTAEVMTSVPTPNQPATPTPDTQTPAVTPPAVSDTSITLSQVNTNAAGFAALLTDIGARENLSELAPLDSVSDLQARGGATYDGVFYVYGNASRVDGFVGNSVIEIGFDDPSNPSVAGGADGFIYVDGPELAAVVETDSFVPIASDTPTFDAEGSITFTNGELANTSGVAAAGFEIAGTLSADTGGGTTQTVDVIGAMAVLFDGDQAFGVGGDISDPSFDLSTPEVFFFGNADR